METFWKWLMRTNARMVFLCALVALILISAWWWWKRSRPFQYREIKMVSTPHARARVGLGIATFFSEQHRKKQNEGNNPFCGDNVQFYYTPPAPIVKSKPEISTSGQPPSPTPRKPSTPTKVSKPEPVYLTYKGLFQRTDGKIVALIENSQTKQSDFFELGQGMAGMQISDIRMEGLALTNNLGVEVIIKRGEPWRLKGKETED